MLDTRSQTLIYILCYKKISVTPVKVYRLYICNWKQNMYVSSCIRLMGNYIKEISVTFVAVLSKVVRCEYF